MARVAVLCPDLLFGSRLDGALRIAGHEVTLASSADVVREQVTEVDLLVVDLTTDAVDGPALVEELRARPELDGLPVLGFYAHVDQEARRRAEEAGFTQVVPRSRMHREAAALVEALAS